MNFTSAPTTVNGGWFLALVILIVDAVFKSIGMLDWPTALIIAAICAVRL